ncbi:MAG: lipase maturation factor family protein [Verrucomicrobiales bacterium]
MDFPDSADYWLTRFCFQRALGFIYLIAFLIALNQWLPLLGEKGIIPVRLFLKRVQFRRAPSLFWLNGSDRFAMVLISFGVALSALAVTGASDSWGLAVSMIVWALLWLLYLSLVNVGQIFYGYGWETLLLESGFLAIFLGSSDTRPPVIVMWLLLWVLFRVMFGAGMIKIRADPCWRDLTCMFYHYETQPLPNPLSWFFHHLPKPVHKAEVLLTHFVELIVPVFYFAPPPLGYIAGALTIFFQLGLMLSGNLSWLNWITIVLCIPCFDDALLSRLIPIDYSVPESSPLFHQVAVSALAVVVLALSWRPTRNLFSRRQLMNASFEPLHLVNSYGAFGGVTRERFEVAVEGTDAALPDETADWREYEFKGKPGNPRRRPCVVSPYHYKLDWQMWFAAMSPYWEHAWFVNFVAKLLRGDRRVLKLLAHNPFPDAPPKYIRARRYRYRFTAFGEPKWWHRTVAGNYFEPVSLNDPKFQELLRRQGWFE